MNVSSLICNPFQERTYVLWGESKAAAVIDCGCSCPAEQKRLTDIVERNGLHVVAHLATHAHLDHLFGAAWLHRTYGVDTFLHEADIPLVQTLADQAAAFGFPWDDFDFPVVPMQIAHDGTLSNPSLRDSQLPEFRVLHTPGHSPGSVCFYFPSSLPTLPPLPLLGKGCPKGEKGVSTLFSGDTLFCCGFGRTDLWGGSYEKLMNSLRTLTEDLPNNTRVYPGHGSTTTIGDELS